MGVRWERTAAVAALVAAAGVLAACHPAKFGEGRNGGDHALSVSERLECPDEQGDLKRTIQAPDGRSCTYRGDGGEEVTLAFLALDGRTPEAALAPTEASFHALLPPSASDGGGVDKASTSTSTTTSSDDGQVKFSTSVSKSDDGDADEDAKGGDAKDDGGKKNEHVTINLPGVHIDANDGGASIHAFGQNVVADDKGATVNGAFNGVKTSIRADDGGAEIRSGFVGKQAVDLTYVLASDAGGPSGVHAASYVARGPVGGPLVVATGTLKEGDRHVDKDRFDDLRELVGLNVRRGGR